MCEEKTFDSHRYQNSLNKYVIPELFSPLLLLLPYAYLRAYISMLLLIPIMGFSVHRYATGRLFYNTGFCKEDARRELYICTFKLVVLFAHMLSIFAYMTIRIIQANDPSPTDIYMAAPPYPDPAPHAMP